MWSSCPKPHSMGTRAAPRYLGIVLCGMLPALAVFPTRGAEWSFEPSAGLRGIYNGNIQLTPDPHPTVWGTRLWSDVKFSGTTEALNVTGGLNVSFDRYLHQRQYNIDNLDLSLHSSYKAERDLFGLNVDAIRSSTLVNELTTTGAVLAYNPQNQLIVSPSWTRALNETASVNATYSYTGTNYNNTSGTVLTKYVNQLASVGLTKSVDEARVFNLAAYYERYETQPSQIRQNTVGVRGGYDHAFSETLSSSFLIGWRRTHSTIASQTSICDAPIIGGVCSGSIVETTSVQTQNSSGLTLNALLIKRFETDTVQGELSQNVYPSGAGSLVQTLRAGVTWTRQWSPSLSSNIGAAAYQTEYIGGVVTSSNSRYYSVNSSLSWRLGDEWRLDAGYNYTRQKYDAIAVAASGNLVYVEFGYAWRKLSFSR